MELEVHQDGVNEASLSGLGKILEAIYQLDGPNWKDLRFPSTKLHSESLGALEFQACSRQSSFFIMACIRMFAENRLRGILGAGDDL